MFACCVFLLNLYSFVLGLRFSACTENIQRRISTGLKKWSENGYMHAFLSSCAILCFSISILTLVSIFLEQGYAKGPIYWLFSWLNTKK